MKKKIKSDIIFYSIIAILIFFILLFSYRAYQNYNIFKIHRTYLRQANIEVLPWMTIHSVERHFNISSEEVDKELKIKYNLSYYGGETVNSLCVKNHLNCTKVIEDLNNLRNR